MAEHAEQQRWFQGVVKKLLRWWLIVPVVVLSLVVLSVFAYRLSQLRGVPDIGHPFDVEAFGTVDIDPADNANADYDRAVGWMTMSSEPDGKDLDKVFDGTWSDASLEVRRWLGDNEAILKLWQVGTEKDHYFIVQPKDLTSWNSIGSASELMDICQLSRLAAIQAESKGRFDEAWKWHLASFRSSRHVGMYDTIFPMLGTYAHLVAVEGIIPWANSETVTAEQLSRALGDILEAYELTALPSSVIRADYFETLDEMNRIDEIRKSYELVMKEMGMMIDGFADDRARFPGSIEMFIENDPELTKRLLQHQVANLLAFVDLPFSERPPLVKGKVTYFNAVSDEAAFMAPKNFLKAVDRSTFARFRLLKAEWLSGSLFRERARQAMLEVILAAEWYRRVYGTFPASLEDLVDAEMLLGFPVDPMSPTGSFVVFKRNPENPQQAEVWCVGRDGIDDGGEFDIPHAYVVGDYGFKIGAGLEKLNATRAK